MVSIERATQLAETMGCPNCPASDLCISSGLPCATVLVNWLEGEDQ